MAIETTEQIVREAPELEAIKLNLLGEAAKLAYRPEFGSQLPSYQVAGLSDGQRAAISAAEQQGIGAYLPFIGQAGQSISGGIEASQQGLAGLAGAYGTTAQGAGALDMAGLTALTASGQYDPRAAYAFMNPYQQAVTQETLREIRRQADIAGQGQAARAVQTGAFGGTREGVQRAEMERNVQDLMAQQIAQGYAQNFAQAQQAAMQTEEAARQRQLGVGSLLGQVGQAYGGLGSQLGNISQAYGNIGQQMGQFGVQQAALGQTAQALQQGDIQFLYGLGGAEQAQRQKEIDAQRASRLQELYAPYQQTAFLSDIYKGAPSTQMATTAASVPQASPFQQVAGTALGALSTYGAGKVAGVF
jgi:hypothetical protein